MLVSRNVPVVSPLQSIALTISLVTVHNKELRLVEEITPLSNLTRASLLVEEKLTAKAELNCEIYKS